jgi:hypothetical protein
MRALEELPDQTKNVLMPLIALRPWVGSHKLQSSIDRINLSYPERPVLIEVSERELPKDRPVFGELETVRDPSDGFANWCEFFELDGHERFVPVAQLGIDPVAEQLQLTRLHGLGRGLAIHLERNALSSLNILSEAVAGITEGGRDVCFIIDYGAAREDHLQLAAQATTLISIVRANAPSAVIALSASSFPQSFQGLTAQPIYERLLYDEVANQVGSVGLIYSDRGSARAEQQSGGSGVIPARIDYPGFDRWTFHRSDETGLHGYIEQARALIGSALWNGDLRVWGTQMIERTARGDASAIDTPGKSTAARINLHLQLQAFYNDREAVNDTEDDWED